MRNEVSGHHSEANKWKQDNLLRDSGDLERLGGMDKPFVRLFRVWEEGARQVKDGQKFSSLTS